MTKPTTPLLVTIPLSHFCEKARWALDYTGVPYTEQRHAPGFHALAVRRAGGQRITPILATDAGVIGDSTDILLWADARAAQGRALYPQEPALREEVLALEERFDTDLGPHVRRAIYQELLPHPKLVLPMLTDGVPLHERALLPLLFGPLRRLMRKSMRIDAAGAARSMAKVNEVIAEVNARLADGGRYLVGDRFTAADLSFAALLAPAAGPDNYAVPLPPLEVLPPAAAEILRGIRATAAGQFCLRMYREHR